MEAVVCRYPRHIRWDTPRVPGGFNGWGSSGGRPEGGSCLGTDLLPNPSETASPNDNRGQGTLLEALVLAAAGGHNVLMVDLWGSGKTMSEADGLIL